MMFKTKVAIGVGVLLVAGVAYARTRKRAPLVCRPGTTFQRFDKPSDVPGYASFGSTTRRAIDSQVRAYGGTCMRSVTVTLADDYTPAAGSMSLGLGELVHSIGDFFRGEPDKEQLDDNGQPLITSPSQLD